MKRLTAWLAGAAGGLAAYRLLRRHSEPAPAPVAEPSEPAEDGPDPRAAELRARLDAVHEEEPPEEPRGPDERRRAVHREARSALDEMRDTNAPEELRSAASRGNGVGAAAPPAPALFLSLQTLYTRAGWVPEGRGGLSGEVEAPEGGPR